MNGNYVRDYAGIESWPACVPSLPRRPSPGPRTSAGSTCRLALAHGVDGAGIFFACARRIVRGQSAGVPQRLSRRCWRVSAPALCRSLPWRRGYNRVLPCVLGGTAEAGASGDIKSAGTDDAAPPQVFVASPRLDCHRAGLFSYVRRGVERIQTPVPGHTLALDNPFRTFAVPARKRVVVVTVTMAPHRSRRGRSISRYRQTPQSTVAQLN
jgi:hypothetical protein